MYMKFKLTFFLFFCSTTTISANALTYERPAPFDFLLDVPTTLKTAWQMSFNTEPATLRAWLWMLGLTGITYYYDEEILSEFQAIGQDLGLGNHDNTKTFIQFKHLNIFRGPTDTGSSLYFLGDGWIHIIVGLSFVGTGLLTASNRALTTGSQIFNGLLASTVANQIGKRSFGRESPHRKTVPRGRWRPFPSFKTYQDNVSAYDAMPSGHIMTATMVFTIIDANYPEYRGWLRPLAYAWCGLLGFQMVNNAVHWISDYPLGIARGYVFGKAATQSHAAQKQISIMPLLIAEKSRRAYGLRAVYNF